MRGDDTEAGAGCLTCAPYRCAQCEGNAFEISPLDGQCVRFPLEKPHLKVLYWTSSRGKACEERSLLQAWRLGMQNSRVFGLRSEGKKDGKGHGRVILHFSCG